jgi:hypothetical protein
MKTALKHIQKAREHLSAAEKQVCFLESLIRVNAARGAQGRAEQVKGAQ